MLPLLERHLPSFPIRFGRWATAASLNLRQSRVTTSLVMALRRNGTNFPIPLSIAAPPQTLGLGDTCTTSLGLRTTRFTTVEAATRLAWLGSDLAAAAGPRLGSAEEPALTPAWRRLVGYQRHVPVLPVRPHDARARISSRISRFDRFRPFSRVQRPNRYAVTQVRNLGRQPSPIQRVGSAIVW
jgi:hypothetical protein